MKALEITSGIFAVFFIAIIVILCVSIGPMILIWAVNSIALAGGSAFYIPHSAWTYFLAIVFMWVAKATISN
jgi:hypothetical protein